MNTSPWNKDRIIGQKRPLQISHIWGIRIRLELEGKTRDLALFNMALDSKLRGCDLVKLKVSDVAYGSSVSSRAMVLQQKTGSPVQFEIPVTLITSTCYKRRWKTNGPISTVLICPPRSGLISSRPTTSTPPILMPSLCRSY